MAYQWDRLALIARVEVHLPAAGLRLGKVHRETQPLQQPGGGDADIGKQGIVEAGNEKGNSH